MAKVTVYDCGKIVGQVEYNSILDYWDGKNYTGGSTGRHLGITQLRKSGMYVLIHGTQWQGERNYAEVVTDKEALDAILKSGHEELLEEKKFARLKALYEELDSD